MRMVWGPGFTVVCGDDPRFTRAAGKDPDEETELKTRPKSTTPKRYRVLFHNDDYTTMEFVVDVLKRFFHKGDAEATYIMLTVHRKGSATVGLYPRDIAETKVDQVTQYARENGMPLLVTAEPE